MEEPGFPVSAAEMGRKIVHAGTTFEVGDHDFSIVPSVTLVVDIPDNIHDSWYRGQIWLAIKMRHVKLRPP